VCHKKCGLTGFSCKCNPDAVFCSTHRLAEAHECNFDYKGSQRQLLAERNPVVAGAKLEKL
jgi:predicted nucleic acid binding AN1-type Zn finger protein